MSRPIDQSIGRLAGRQRGYVTRVQLLELGLGAEAIVYRVRAGELIRVHNGVYALGHAPRAFVDRAYAAVLACGRSALLSHGSAASLWGIYDRWWTPFEVIVETARRRPGIRVHRVALDRKDVRRHLGIRVTSPARTVFDIAPRLTDKALTRAVNELRIERLLKLEQLAELTSRLPRHRGASRVKPLIETSTGPTRSELEDAFVAFTERFGLPRPEMNARIAGYEVDALFREQRVIVELDGYQFHGTRQAFEKDRERDAATLAAGLVTVRITWERLTETPETEADRLNAIIAGRS
ncbi:MAG TPA: type IV toxin-antitoxin system AbiEi family antitoxin domain-containing protein [Solirubrobacteraceae bacterium]|nr:type IV toxin-antitoxin system AbiEi family antitoxin domain-containing protein [Solirubrobacteraceae bacterium]